MPADWDTDHHDHAFARDDEDRAGTTDAWLPERLTDFARDYETFDAEFLADCGL